MIGESANLIIQMQAADRRVIPLSTDSKQDYCTPRWFYALLKKRWPFTLDAAASKENALEECYYTGDNPLANGLTAPWDRYTFCNPPYKDIMPWVEKAVTEATRGCTGVLLLPARLETKWFYAYSVGCETEIIIPRLAFEGAPGKKAPPHGSMLMIFTPETVNNPTTYGDYRRIKLAHYQKPSPQYMRGKR